MNTTVKYIAPWLAAAAISGAIGLAPIASAAPAATAGSQGGVSNATSSNAPAPTPFEYGTSPLVEGNVGADPAIPYFPGQGRPF
jgi:hypothetical protein